jgi:predicted nucleic acid-binding protein
MLDKFLSIPGRLILDTCILNQLQEFESHLMSIPDFCKDPFDRLLMIQYKMGNCDAFLTTDRNTIWRHRNWLETEDIQVLCPSEFWELLQPFAKLWW